MPSIQEKGKDSPAQSSDQRRQQQEGAKIPHSILFLFFCQPTVSHLKGPHIRMCVRLVKRAPARWPSDQLALLLSRRAFGAAAIFQG